MSDYTTLINEISNLLMNTFSKKVAAVVLTATTVVSMTGVGSIVNVASAQTTADLLAQIAALQAQLNAQQSGNSMAATFNTNLQVGSKGNDVVALQNVLISKGYLAAGYNTGYFGALTKAAVTKWQAAAGLPATGFFGPMSRAKLNGMVSTTPSNNNTTPVVNNTTGALLVTPNNSGDVTTTIISGSGQARVARYTFTAPATAGVTITGLTFNKVGVVADALISNLYLADVATGAVVAQFSSLSNGVATFSGLNLMVNAGQSWVGELRADVSSSATAGNTIAFDLAGVMTVGNAATTGLPVKGNVLTVTTVSNPSIATITLTAQSVGSTVNAGSNTVLVASWTANVTNSPVDLKSLQLTTVGSANLGDLRNLSLRVNGTQVASLPVAATSLVFGLASNPVRLQTGNSNISLYADIAGSPNRTVQFSLLRPYDVVATDTQYKQNITATLSGSSTSITINTGSITVSTDATSPTSDIPAGASGVTIGKFKVYAAGEPVKVKFMSVQFIKTGGSAWTDIANVTDDLSNVRIIADDGRQLGNSISTITSGSTNNTCNLAASTYITCYFGTSSSNINFIIPANTTQVFSVMADLGSSADISTLQVVLPTMSSNLEGQTSFQSASSGTASAANRTMISSSASLTVVADPGLSGPTYINGAAGVKIGAYVLKASAAQSATVRTVTITRNAGSGLNLQSMKVMVDGVQFGNTESQVGSTGTYTFSGQDIVIPAGGSKIFNVVADIINSSSAGTYSGVTSFTGWTANGGISGSNITFGSSVTGQAVTVSTGPTVTVTTANSTAKAQIVSMDTTGNAVFTANFSNDNVDDVYITNLTVTDVIGSSGSKTTFTNATLEDENGTVLAGPVPVNFDTGSTVTSTAVFSISGSGFVIPKNQSRKLTVKANVPDLSSNAAASGSTHAFKIYANSDVTVKAVNAPSATVTVTGAPKAGNTQTVYRTKLSLSSGVIDSSTERTRKSTDYIAWVKFAAGTKYKLTLSTVTLKFTGSAVTSGATAFAVNLKKYSDNSAFGSAASTNCTPVTGNTCSVTFAPELEIAQGDSETAKVLVSSANFTEADNAQSLSVTIDAVGDVLWTDGSSTGIQLESSVVPFTVADVTYN